MNINPSDGHGSAWGSEPGCTGTAQVSRDQLSYWPAAIDCQFGGSPLTADYKSNVVWQQPASHIMIMRHDQGTCDAYGIWSLNFGPTAGTSLYNHFSTDYRQQVTGGGPITFYIRSGTIMNDNSGYGDPIFSSGFASGNIHFNWYNSNNGARLVLNGGQNLAGENTNNDDTQGLVRTSLLQARPPCARVLLLAPSGGNALTLSCVTHLHRLMRRAWSMGAVRATASSREAPPPGGMTSPLSARHEATRSAPTEALR